MTSTARDIARRGLLAAILAMATMPALAAGPDVVVTVKPVHGLVASIMAGVGTPHLLIDGGASPHTYAMKPSDVRRLNKADVVVRVSPRLEAFLEKPLAMVGKKTRVVTLTKDTPDLKLYDVRTGLAFEPHGHDDEHKPTANGDHDHDHSGLDPHIWLDPRNAKAIASHVAEVLASVDKADAVRIRANTRALLERLDTLDRDLSAKLQPIHTTPFLVFHDAYQYFERHYALNAAGSVTINPDVPPSAHRISQLREKVRKAGIVCVFAEPQFAPRVIAAVVEGTGVRQGTLDPLGAAIPAGADHYWALMEGLAGNLAACLAQR